MNASYQASLVNRHIRRFTGFLRLAFCLRHFKTKCTFLEYLKHVISSTKKMFHLTSKLHTPWKLQRNSVSVQHRTWPLYLSALNETPGLENQTRAAGVWLIVDFHVSVRGKIKRVPFPVFICITSYFTSPTSYPIICLMGLYHFSKLSDTPT